MVEVIKSQISNRENIFKFLMLGAIGALALYFYLYGHTISNIVGRQNTEKSISSVEASVEKLESSYLELKGRIDANLAQTKGFTSISSATYISRKSLGKGLTLNNEI